MTRRRVKLVALVVAVLWTVVGCEALKRHPENSGVNQFDIIALGDSYTAGNAADDGSGQGYYEFSADDPRYIDEVRRGTIRNKPWVITVGAWDSTPFGCMRHEDNYSRVLYEMLGSTGAYFNGACSGDTAHNVAGFDNEPPQLDGFTNQAENNEVDLVTLSIGGNDMEFANIMKQCFVDFAYHAVNCESALELAELMMYSSAGQYSDIQNRMRRALNHVIDTFPNARIVLVGYPLIWEDENYSMPVCPGAVCTHTIYPGARLESGLNLLNSQQQKVIDDLNAERPENPFTFLPLHKQDGSGFFDGHGLRGPAHMADWIYDQEGFGSVEYRERWFHPNMSGHANIAFALFDLPFVQDAFWDSGPGPVVHSLALGDGYSAGNGALGTVGDGYMDASPEDFREGAGAPGCRRNINNYIHQLMGTLNLSRGWTITAACSGGTIQNLSNQYENLSEAERQKVDLVTVMAGGMDLQWTDIVQHCYVDPKGNLCKSELNGAVSTLNQLLQLHQQGLWSYNPLVVELREIATALPNAQTVVIGYPVINEDPNLVLCLTTTNPCPVAQQYSPLPRLREGLNLLNQVQQEVVTQVNTEVGQRFAFLPLHNNTNTGLFDGHGVGGTGETLITSDETTLDFEELYHPNREGHTAIADALNNMLFVQAVITGVPQNN